MKKGFTLIELLVVVLIIGILASVAVPKYMLAVRKTKATAALAFLEKLSDAQSVYFLANGEYPPDIESLDIIPPVVKPYSFSLEDGGFTVRAHPNNQGGMPILYAYGAYTWPHYGHLINQRYCIGGTPESSAVCCALGKAGRYVLLSVLFARCPEIDSHNKKPRLKRGFLLCCVET